LAPFIERLHEIIDEFLYAKYIIPLTGRNNYGCELAGLFFVQFNAEFLKIERE
jgi:hypothetical protein